MREMSEPALSKPPSLKTKKRPQSGQPPLFDVPSQSETLDTLPSPTAEGAVLHALAEVDNQVLRRANGELRTVRHPVEMALLEPKARKLSLWGHKAWLFLISYALSTDGNVTDTGVLWRVPMRTLMRDARFNTNNYDVLKDALMDCQKTVVDWSRSARDAATGEVRSWSSTQLLGSVEFVNDSSKRLYIEWSLTPVLLRELRAYRHYYMVDLAVVSDIRSNSALALYKIVSRYKSSPGGLTMRMPWRSWIAPLTGEPEDAISPRGKPRYEEFRYFNRDVVQRAVKELNAVQAEFVVEPVLITKGREVIELQFKVTQTVGYSRAKAHADAAEALDEEAQRAIDQAVETGTTPTFAAKLQQEYGSGQLAEKAQAALSAHGIGNRAGFLVASLRAQHSPARRAQGQVGEATPLKVIRDLTPEQLVKARRDEACAQAKFGWPAVPMEVQEDYLRRFGESESCSTAFVRKAFQESGLKKPFVAAAFFPWLAKTMAEDAATEW